MIPLVQRQPRAREVQQARRLGWEWRVVAYVKANGAVAACGRVKAKRGTNPHGRQRVVHNLRQTKDGPTLPHVKPHLRVRSAILPLVLSSHSNRAETGQTYGRTIGKVGRRRRWWQQG